MASSAGQRRKRQIADRFQKCYDSVVRHSSSYSVHTCIIPNKYQPAISQNTRLLTHQTQGKRGHSPQGSSSTAHPLLLRSTYIPKCNVRTGSLGSDIPFHQRGNSDPPIQGDWSADRTKRVRTRSCDREATIVKHSIHHSIRPSEVPRSRLFAARGLHRFLGVVRDRETRETRLAACVQRPPMPGTRPRHEFFLLSRNRLLCGLVEEA